MDHLKIMYDNKDKDCKCNQAPEVRNESKDSYIKNLGQTVKGKALLEICQPTTP